jgi:prephenate dehydrogenase
MKTLTAGGFRDMTRLAGGSPAMHRDILLTNRDAVLRWVDTFQRELSNLRDTLTAAEDDSPADLTSFFERARDARAEWATQTTREGELLQGTDADLSKEGFGDQMGRMLFGGFMRRKSVADRIGRPNQNSQSDNKRD